MFEINKLCSISPQLCHHSCHWLRHYWPLVHYHPPSVSHLDFPHVSVCHVVNLIKHNSMSMSLHIPHNSKSQNIHHITVSLKIYISYRNNNLIQGGGTNTVIVIRKTEERGKKNHWNVNTKMYQTHGESCQSRERQLLPRKFQILMKLQPSLKKIIRLGKIKDG